MNVDSAGNVLLQHRRQSVEQIPAKRACDTLRQRPHHRSGSSYAGHSQDGLLFDEISTAVSFWLSLNGAQNCLDRLTLLSM